MLWDGVDHRIKCGVKSLYISRPVAGTNSFMRSASEFTETGKFSFKKFFEHRKFPGCEGRGIMKQRNKCRESGNSLIEFAMIAPWFFVLFTGVADAGFATYGLIAVQNAARVAVLHGAANATTASDQAGACALVIQELTGLPKIGSGFSSNCSSDPVTVTVNYCDGTTPCTGSTTSVDSGPAAFVAVTYQLPHLFQLPFTGLTSITRTAEMRLRDPLP